MPRWAPFFACLLVACSTPGTPLGPVPALTATPVPPVVFPRDAGAHDNLTEWWYYTGHLRTPDGSRQFGFEYTVFQLRRGNVPSAYLAHFAVTDVTGQTFSHQARVSVGPAQPGFNLDVQGWKVWNDGSADQIAAQMTEGPGAQPAYAMQLRLSDRKPPALHNGGYIEYGVAGGSYYYSRTRLAVAGAIGTIGEPSQRVEGEAWMDHQWGNFVVTAEGSWDWYSLQLADNTELMLYVLRGPDGSRTRVYGSRILADGSVKEIAPNTVEPILTGSWESAHTGAVYPSGWQLELPGLGLRLAIAPLVRDQELYFPGRSAGGPTYWEGAVSVRGLDGSPDGEGYVELTGYAPARPFALPAG